MVRFEEIFLSINRLSIHNLLMCRVQDFITVYYMKLKTLGDKLNLDFFLLSLYDGMDIHTKKNTI